VPAPDAGRKDGDPLSGRGDRDRREARSVPPPHGAPSTEVSEMQKLRCWFLGHDRMASQGAHGVCLRCGQRERVPDLSRMAAPVDGTGTDDGGRLAGMPVQALAPQHPR
jgi:hypothetical protein